MAFPSRHRWIRNRHRPAGLTSQVRQWRLQQANPHSRPTRRRAPRFPRIRILVVPRPRSPKRNRKAKAIEDTRKPSVRPWQSSQVWTILCWPVPLHLQPQLDYLADGRFRFSLIPRRPAIRSIVSTEVRKLAAASSNVAEAAAI